jgi:polyisoprenoid-binding protein YceI
MNRRFLAALALAAAALPAGAADTWTVDPAHSETTFTVRHLLSKVSGRFDTFDARIVTDAAKPENSSVEFTIQAASIDTNNDKRDAHLRSADFFDVEKHPTITFKGIRIEPLVQNRFNVTGELTMRGVTKQVTVPVEFLGTQKDPWGNEKAGFALQTTLNRKDYGIVWNQALDAGGYLLGDDVQVSISLQVVKKKDAAR